MKPPSWQGSLEAIVKDNIEIRGSEILKLWTIEVQWMWERKIKVCEKMQWQNQELP